MAEIKLVVSDIDGTLVDENEALPEKLVGLAQRLKERGIIFTLATGRLPYEMIHYARTLGVCVPCITGNGSVIIRDGELIEKFCMKTSVFKDILVEADSAGMTVLFGYHDHETAMSSTEWLKKRVEKRNNHVNIFKPSPNDWDSLELFKITVCDDKADGGILRWYEAVCEASREHFVMQYGMKGFEILPRQCNKGTGLIRLTELLDISTEEVLAVGDQLNDIEMLNTAGIGVCVANGVPQLREVADYVCVNPLADGVLEAIERFCV